MPGFGVIKNPPLLDPLPLPVAFDGGIRGPGERGPLPLPSAHRCPCSPGDGGEGGGPSLAEVMQCDGPICARGPWGRGPFSPRGSASVFVLAAFRDKRGGVQAHAPGEAATALHRLALHAGKRRFRQGQSSEVSAYWWQSQALNPSLWIPSSVLGVFSGLVPFFRGSGVEK